MAGDKKQELQLDYPCRWTYKIIGLDENDMISAAGEIIEDRPFRLSVSRRSETAKYTSLNVELTVESEAHRKALYDAFKAHRTIKLVL